MIVPRGSLSTLRPPEPAGQGPELPAGHRGLAAPPRVEGLGGIGF